MSELHQATRRERLRRQTIAELKQHALAQVAEGGPQAMSFTAVARSMGMSGAALYRYFASRDELLVALAIDASNDLADTLAAAADAATHGPAARLRAVAAAYRQWALAAPHRYRLIFATRHGAGGVQAERTDPAAHRSMVVLLDALADLRPPPRAGPDRDLAGQLERWAEARASGRPAPAVLHLGMLAWTRLHGVVSLELEGVFTSMGVDPALVFAAEVDRLVQAASGT